MEKWQRGASIRMPVALPTLGVPKLCFVRRQVFEFADIRG